MQPDTARQKPTAKRSPKVTAGPATDASPLDIAERKGYQGPRMRLPLGPAALLALLGTFLLPFVDFSCQGKKVATFTGYETAFGKEMTSNLPLSKWLNSGQEGENSIDIRIEHKDHTDGKPMVAAALIVAIVGGLAGFAMRPMGALCGFAACVLLLVSQDQMQREVKEQQVPLVVLTFQTGFWASVACAGAGGVLCLLGRK